MNAIVLTFLVINAVLILLLPRRWAPFPLLAGTCYMTLGQGIELGSFHFPLIRMLLIIGLMRLIMRGEHLAGRMNSLDWLIVVWAAWALISSLFHEDASGTLVNRLGLVYNACGIYFLLRVFCQSLDDVVTIFRITAILLIPLSIMILFEKMTGHNLFSDLSDIPIISEIRDGRIRAQGPFAHPILAGTIGAVCFPFMMGIWRQYRKTASAGILACSSMIYASGSSGPIMSAAAAVGALFMWRYRHRMRLIRWLAVFGYIGLDLVMKAPAYYVIAHINLTGSSTGWHRAFLIETALNHLSEWWLAGTDYTRDWIPYGVNWSESHADITNHYLQMGVLGGLPLMLLFIAILLKGFSYVGQAMRQMVESSPQTRFMTWVLGASLFVLTVTFISVSFFDQSFVFIYLTLAAIGSVWSSTARIHGSQKVPYQHALTEDIIEEQVVNQP